MRKLNTILFVLGLVFLGYIVWTIDAVQVWRELRRLGWGLLLFILGEGVAEMVHTVGWRYCLSGSYRSLPWHLLFRMRMAGYAINYLTPTASLGGEVSKAALLAANHRGPEAVSGVLIEKLCFASAQLTFVVVGCVLFGGLIHLPPPLLIPMLVGTACVGGGLIAFFFLQRRGMLGGLVRWLASRKGGKHALKTASMEIGRVDQALREFYRDRPRDMWLAAGWHFAGFSIGIIQTWIFFRLLNENISLPVAAVVCCLGMWFDLVTFAIPLNAGVLEGGRMMATQAVGFGAILGFTYGIATRLAQLFWALLGLIFYSFLVTADGKPLCRFNVRTIPLKLQLKPWRLSNRDERNET